MFANKHLPVLSVTPTIRGLMFLSASEWQFYLTGSRFFHSSFRNDLPDTTDYDFFAQDDPIIRKQLTDAGFKAVHDKTYANICELSGLYQLGSVQVQLVLDAQKKDKVQTHIHAIFGSTMNSVAKPIRRNIWRLAYRCC